MKNGGAFLAPPFFNIEMFTPNYGLGVKSVMSAAKSRGTNNLTT